MKAINFISSGAKDALLSLQSEKKMKGITKISSGQKDMVFSLQSEESQ